MAMRQGDNVRLLEGHGEQDPPDVVTMQPRAGLSSSTSSGISSLSIVIKALHDEREYKKKCWCFFCPQQSQPLLASALLIGNSKREGQVASNASGRRLHHVDGLKNHLSQLNVEIFKCYENYQDTRDELNDTISRFLSQGGVSLFVLYYTGPTDDEGNWEFTTTEYHKECKDFIRLATIVKRWKRRRNPSCQLLIIVDAENSGKWVEIVKSDEAESNISIMAPSASVGGQYTRSLIGSQGVEFYPVDIQQKIDRFLSDDSSLPPRFCCYVAWCK